jgi:hypothetical protein
MALGLKIKGNERKGFNVRPCTLRKAYDTGTRWAHLYNTLRVLLVQGKERPLRVQLTYQREAESCSSLAKVRHDFLGKQFHRTTGFARV